MKEATARSGLPIPSCIARKPTATSLPQPSRLPEIPSPSEPQPKLRDGQQPPAGTPAERAELEAASSTTNRAVPAGTDAVVISNSAVGIGGRWDTFQSRLRQRRKEAAAGCKTCTVGAAFPSATAPIPSARLFSAYFEERSHGK